MTSDGSEPQIDSERRALADKEAVSAVMRRSRKTGGVLIKEAQVLQFQQWFRTLAKRGFVTSSFLGDAEKAKKTFREEFPNGMTRGQYVRSILTFFSGLNDDEFPVYFPGLEREKTVDLLLTIGSEGSKEHRSRLAEKHRTAHPRSPSGSAFEQTS
jgi:hypothetical protein